MSGETVAMADRVHTQDCLDAQFMHHAATGGDLEECSCPPAPDSAETLESEEKG